MKCDELIVKVIVYICEPLCLACD